MDEAKIINIKRNSPNYLALCYLKTRGQKWSTANDLVVEFQQFSKNCSGFQIC